MADWPVWSHTISLEPASELGVGDDDAVLPIVDVKTAYPFHQHAGRMIVTAVCCVVEPRVQAWGDLKLQQLHTDQNDVHDIRERPRIVVQRGGIESAVAQVEPSRVDAVHESSPDFDGPEKRELAEQMKHFAFGLPCDAAAKLVIVRNCRGDARRTLHQLAGP